MNKDREISPISEVFYIVSMLFCTQSAMESIKNLEDKLKIVSLEDVSQLNSEEILNEFQNLIIQAAALSKYFWPIRKPHEWRGKQLRRVFSIHEDSPIKSRSLRDAIEHFDERLDKYLGDGMIGIFLPQYVGPRPPSGSIPGHYFRAYFIDEARFQLLDECYEIAPISEAMQKIHHKLLTFSQNGGRFR